MTGYFSERENGPRTRTEQVISPTVWAGLAGTVQALINSGAFGLRFPERCSDGQVVCGCDSDAFAASVSAEMPGLAWPLETTCVEGDGFLSQRQPFAPDTLLILDFIEFVHAAVAKPILGKYHDFFNHHHLTFDQEAGQEDFRATVNCTGRPPEGTYRIEFDDHDGDAWSVRRAVDRNDRVLRHLSCRPQQTDS